MISCPPLITIVLGEELPLICELKEDLNFQSSVQTVFINVDMEKGTVNRIPGTIMGNDIIKYETETETGTIILPNYIHVTRKGRGPGGSDVSYSGVCKKDDLKF